ncbi:MAG: hypothetical protein WAN20_15950 [Pseudonocardiaceae bacterium]
MTEYLGLAVERFRGQVRRVDEQLLAHISSAHSETSACSALSLSTSMPKLAQLDPTGHRPTTPATGNGHRLVNETRCEC